MFKTDYGEFDENSWEKLCQKIFMMRYKDSDYQSVPADDKDDFGIEGFTRDGIVFQCYCPNENYPPKELYAKQMTKINKDINKLKSNGEELKKILGKIKVKKWCFVTPYYKNKRLLIHCNNKKEEILKNNLDYIDPAFDIVIYGADYFIKEINILIRFDNCILTYNYNQYNPSNDEVAAVMDKLKKDKPQFLLNLNRKLEKIIPLENNNKLERMEENYKRLYVTGIKIINLIEINFPDLHDEVISIKRSYESELCEKCCMNIDTLDNNQKLFKEIREDLKQLFSARINNGEKKLMDEILISYIINYLIVGWLLECSLDFI